MAKCLPANWCQLWTWLGNPQLPKWYDIHLKSLLFWSYSLLLQQIVGLNLRFLCVVQLPQFCVWCFCNTWQSDSICYTFCTVSHKQDIVFQDAPSHSYYKSVSYWVVWIHLRIFSYLSVHVSNLWVFFQGFSSDCKLLHYHCLKDIGHFLGFLISVPNRHSFLQW